MEYKDYYRILGVAKTATEKELRSAYRKLARQFHPDVNPNNKEAEDRFKEINEAYEVLSDTERRKRYDLLGERWQEYESWLRAHQAGQAPAPPPPEEFLARSRGGPSPAGGQRAGRSEYRTLSEDDLRDLFGDEDPFSDFFNTYFGGDAPREASRSRSRRPARVEQQIDVSLADAYRGASVVLALTDPDGSTRRIEVKIPAGVDTGSRIRLAGQGVPGARGGAAGDLYLIVNVLPDPRFDRRGDDLYTRVHAPLMTMLLGGEISVTPPDGKKLALRIPQETQDGRSFRLRGQGMPRLDRPGQRGDLFAEVHVSLPQGLTARQRDLLRQLDHAEPAEAAS